MLFNSVTFLVFFTVVLVLDAWLRRWPRPRKCFLLAASYFFYGSWDWRFLSLIIFSTVLDWFVGNALAAAEGPKRRKHLLWLSLAGNLGVLGVFKYFDFFVTSAGELLRSLGFGVSLPLLHVILPVGISFYTFQTLSYTIDIHRRSMRPARSLLDFAVFVAFFPQLVAGPIVRARDFLPQLENMSRPSSYGVGWGLYQILAGLVKKVVIADFLGARLVDPVFNDPDKFGIFGGLLCIYGYAFQIYGDFAGYSQIAIGTGRLLGFRLPENFRSPYLARNIPDLWRRWHISLSTWLRDYLYISLGGNRKGTLLTYRNLLLTMLLGGLWHGADWNYVLWGGLHGAALAVAQWRRSRWKRLGVQAQPDSFARIFRQRFLMFHWWCLTLTFFRTHTIEQFSGYWGTLLRGGGGTPGSAGIQMLVFAAVVFFLGERYNARLERAFIKLPPELRGVITAIVLALIGIMSTSVSPFIYFQF